MFWDQCIVVGLRRVELDFREAKVREERKTTIFGKHEDVEIGKTHLEKFGRKLPSKIRRELSFDSSRVELSHRGTGGGGIVRVGGWFG